MVTRPLLRYHGGKFLLAPWILEHLPAHRIYVEPFGGAASVLLTKSRSYAEVYNDLDGEIVNLFRIARDRGVELRAALELTPFAREEFVLSYAPSDDPLEQARRTAVRSFMGFGSNSLGKASGFRACSNRCGTTPAHDWRNYPDALSGIIDRLRGVVIESRDALLVMPAHDSPETLFYVDPPYVASTRDKGGDYRFEMTDEQHRALAELLHAVTGMVTLSGYRCELYDELYRDWTSIDRRALADGARARIETLWINPGCAAALSRATAQRSLVLEVA
ncbi:DNA adenine methylase [Paraburkholderia youngii]|uniref:DNA adenine methylase n=1 Tax=Paraburkholderia youngii TaxID=2782701 RepID=UPI001592A31B|nr:DNA adenine methylase [Paraburkholderia youngii]NUX55943.1 DNA adenine methylase [Paraburkholderia youngii]